MAKIEKIYQQQSKYADSKRLFSAKDIWGKNDWNFLIGEFEPKYAIPLEKLQNDYDSVATKSFDVRLSMGLRGHFNIVKGKTIQKVLNSFLKMMVNLYILRLLEHGERLFGCHILKNGLKSIMENLILKN